MSCDQTDRSAAFSVATQNSFFKREVGPIGFQRIATAVL